MSKGNTTVAELLRIIENISNKIDNFHNDMTIKFNSLSEKVDELHHKWNKENESVKNVVNNVSDALNTNLSEIIKKKIAKFASNEDTAIPMIRESITNTVYLKALRLIFYIFVIFIVKYNTLILSLLKRINDFASP